MATDTNSLMADAKCYVPYLAQWPLLALGFLKQLLLSQNSMADTTANALLESSKCYACLAPGQLTLVALALLKQIMENGLGRVICGTAVPTDDPGVDCAVYFRTDTANIYYWNDAGGAWVQHS